MSLALFGIFIVFLGGCFALIPGLRPGRLACAGLTAGCALLLISAARVLAHGEPLSLTVPWSVPYAAFSFRMDALSAFFIMPVSFLSVACAIYGLEYLEHEAGHASTGRSWFFYNLLVAGMLVVLLAQNGMLFLIAWEVMSLAPLFLIIRGHHNADVRFAGLVYLIAAHLGAACLTGCFLLLGREAGTLEFDGFSGMPPVSVSAAFIFILGLAGFGAKAGFLPFHVWLPEAHPAAPSHVSALMSGAMIKMGIYGILRMLGFFNISAAPLWWGAALLFVGAASGVMGVLLALGQHDLKRLLACHSVENIGIIILGCGLGMVGLHYRVPLLAACGFGGALLHTLNHALFKGLLFLGAGAVAHACQTREVERLGGLLRVMPRTGAFFLIGSVAICGLPPLNGFVSEFLLYFGSFSALGGAAPRPAAALAIAAIVVLALIGGLAAACFVKAFGVVFLGEPRRHSEVAPKDPGILMQFGMGVLALACIIIGLGGSVVPHLLRRPVAVLSGLMLSDGGSPFGSAQIALAWISGVALLLIGLVLALFLLRQRLLSGREVETSVTWDCGYEAPGPRMQYSASSFAAPLVGFFAVLVCPARSFRPLKGYFPASEGLHTDVTDLIQDRLWRPLFRRVGNTA